MEKYQFKDKYFAVSEAGVHLLRNGYNYKTIPWNETETVRLRKGKGIRNWLLLLIFGGGLFAAAMWYGLGIYRTFTNPESDVDIYIEAIAATAVALLVGGFFIYRALKIEEIIEFSFMNGFERFTSKSLRKKGELDALFDYIQAYAKIERKEGS